MVAGGGASVIYSDTICDLGGTNELANYGEYSGAPSEQQTYEYAKTILSLMTQEKHPEGKVREKLCFSAGALVWISGFTLISRARSCIAGFDHRRRYCQLYQRCGYLQGYRHRSN